MSLTVDARSDARSVGSRTLRPAHTENGTGAAAPAADVRAQFETDAALTLLDAQRVTSPDVVTLELKDGKLAMHRYQAPFVLRGEEMVRPPKDQWKLVEEKALPIGVETGFTADLVEVLGTGERVLRLTAAADKEIRWSGASSQPSTSRCAFFAARATADGTDALLQGFMIKSGGAKFDPAAEPRALYSNHVDSPAKFIMTDLKPSLRPVMPMMPMMSGRPDSFGARGAHEPRPSMPNMPNMPNRDAVGTIGSSPLATRITSMRGGAA